MLNEIKVGNGGYIVSDKTTDTNITMYNKVNQTYRETLTMANELKVDSSQNVVPKYQWTSDIDWYTDVSAYFNKYIYQNSKWYRIKTIPVKTAVNKRISNSASTIYRTIAYLTPYLPENAIEYSDELVLNDTNISLGDTETGVVTRTNSLAYLYNQYIDINGTKVKIPDNAAVRRTDQTVAETFVPGGRITLHWHEEGGFVVLDRTGEMYTKMGDGWVYDDNKVGYQTVVNRAFNTVSQLVAFIELGGKYFIEEDGNGNKTYYELTDPMIQGTTQAIAEALRIATVPYKRTEVEIESIFYYFNADSYTTTCTGVEQEAAPFASFDFVGEDIISVKGVKTINVTGDELSYDTFEAEVISRCADDLFLTDNDGNELIDVSDNLLYTRPDEPDFRLLPYASPVYYYRDNSLYGVYYSESVTRNEKNQYTLKAFSIIGLLNTRYHKGGVYVNKTFQYILTDILGNMAVTINDSVKNIVLTGWLPYDTCRNNLHKLLFATNVIFLKADDGTFLFTHLVKNDNPEVIPDERVYDTSTVEYCAPCSSVQLTEHIYELIETTDAETLFDNTDSTAADEKMVIFDHPVDTTTFQTTGNLTVDESGNNYAVVTGQGVLTAKPYTHITHVVQIDNDEEVSEHIVKSDKCTLISPINSTSVANRLMSYYKSARKIINPIRVLNEKCGTVYKVTDKYGDESAAYLSKMTFNATSFIKADCEFIADFTPSTDITDYTRSVILTKEKETELGGYWECPKTGTIRVILIGGGNGGSSGYAGANSIRTNQDGMCYDPGLGGNAGIKGNGGYIKTVDLQVTQGQTFAFHIGSGSSGGAQCTSSTTNNTPVAELTHQQGAGATTFGSNSSATGGSLSTGVMDIFTGTVYALPGSAGCAGSAGGAGGNYYNNYAKSSWAGESGLDVTYEGKTYYGGSGGDAQYMNEIGNFGCPNEGFVGGTGGGGAAVGHNGRNGSSTPLGSGTIAESRDTNYYSKQMQCYFADTGSGADADARENASLIGCGGSAGHGGGGEGGHAGFSENPIYEYDDGYQYISFTALVLEDSVHTGRGGYGGKAGDGADGGIIIYI